MTEDTQAKIRALIEARIEERKQIISILLGIAARESGSDHPQSEYDQANLARNLRMVVEQLTDLPWDGEFWLQSVCGMAFDYGAALGRIKALEGIYISVDAVLGGAESKGLLRDIWAKLEIPGRCTHARQPHPFKQLARIECPYPDCPDGTASETILVCDEEGGEYELTRFVARHGEAFVVEWQQLEKQIDHEIEGRTDLASLRRMGGWSGPYYSMPRPTAGLSRFLDDERRSEFRNERRAFAAIQSPITLQPSLRCPVCSRVDGHETGCVIGQPIGQASSVDRRRYEISAAGEFIRSRPASADRADEPIHSVAIDPMEPADYDPFAEDDDGNEDDDS